MSLAGTVAAAAATTAATAAAVALSTATSSSNGELITIQGFKTPSYSDADKVADALWEGNYNPDSMDTDVKMEFFEDVPIGATGGDAKFLRQLPTEITFEILLDDYDPSTDQIDHTNALGYIMDPSTLIDEESGLKVSVDLEKFKEVCQKVNGDIHQPNYLEISYGTELFYGKLKKLDVNVERFKSSGEATKAKLKVTFVEAHDPDFVRREANLSSPDMTHHYLVKEGDTLPMISMKTYGKPGLYIELAKANKLNSFRYLKVGSRLILPPLI